MHTTLSLRIKYVSCNFLHSVNFIAKFSFTGMIPLALTEVYLQMSRNENVHHSNARNCRRQCFCMHHNLVIPLLQ